MSTTPDTQPRQMPRGGKKGGTMFPRISLAEALPFARKLVGKTHTGPQKTDVVLMGVFGSKHDKGKLGMSALKQYGLLTGDGNAGHTAAELAKQIAASPPDQLVTFYRQAALKPKVFKALFDTFHGDAVTKARLKQRLSDLEVHPDEAAKCVDLYVASAITAELVTMEGDRVVHLASGDLALSTAAAASDVDQAEADEQDDQAPGESSASNDETAPLSAPASGRNQQSSIAETLPPRAVFNVNVTLDSSMDIEKLQKQLELLKKFGAI